MKKSIIAGFSALILTCSMTYAKEINWIECDIASDGVVSIEQNLKSQKEQAQISMVVYYPGKAFDDIANDGLMNVIAKSDQVVSEQDGKYKFEFKIDGESDFYTVEVSSDNGDFDTFKILYSDPEDIVEFVSKINSASSSEVVYNLLYGEDEGFKKVGFYIDTKDDINKVNISKILFSSLENEDITTENRMSKFKKAHAIELLNENYDIALNDAENYLNINKAKFNEYWNKTYITDTVRKEVINNLKNKSFKSEKEFNDALLEQIVLYTVQYTDGYGNLRDILVEFEDITGIETAGIGSSQYRGVLGNSYSDYAELEEALNNQPTSSGGSGGGGGGSNGSGKDKHNTASDDFSLNTEIIAPPAVVPLEKVYFNDLDNYDWAKEAINYLADIEVINGKTEGAFYPQDNITREEFSCILVKTFNIKKGNLETEFSDVAKDSWYENNVKIAASAGIVLGKGDNCFGVGENITRQDMAVMISRACNLADESDVEKFADDMLISNYAKSAVYSAKNAGIISGVGDNNFNPLGFATRAEAAMIVYNAIN